MLAMLAPEFDVDLAAGVERRDEFVAVLRRPVRELLRAGEVEPDALELMRQLGHAKVSSPKAPEGAPEYCDKHTPLALISLNFFRAFRPHWKAGGRLRRPDPANHDPPRPIADHGPDDARRPDDTRRTGGAPHRHPCRHRLPRRRPRPQDQARGALSLLDYSTLDKRKAACAAEIEVNRPFAPALYRRVVAVTRESDGRLALDGAGEPVEWAVEMRSLRRGSHPRSPRRRATGIGLDLADELACVLAAAHARAPVVAAAPWIAALADFIDQNATAFAETPELFAADDVARLTRASRAALARDRALLEARGRQRPGAARPRRPASRQYRR